MTPSDEATNTVSEGTGDDANRGQRQYSADGLAAGDYDLALFPAENVSVDSDGVVSFEDDGDNDVADWTETAAEFEVVNGAAVTDDNGHVVNVTAVNGTIQFSIDSVTADEVIPVVIAADTGSSDGTPDLDLDDDNLPTEDFGIGGQTNWIPAEAATGFGDTGDVVQVNTDDGFYTLDITDDGTADVLITYVSGDDYLYSSSADFDDVAITEAQFESWLSVDDTVTVTGYNPGGATFGSDATIHDIDNDVPNAPSDLTGQLTDGDIELDWTAPTNPDVVNYEVQISTQDADGDFPDFGSLADTTDTEFTLADAPAGVHQFRVLAENDNTDASPASNVVEVTVPEGADETSPVIETITTDDNDTTGEIDADDQIALGFDEAVVVADGTEIELTDDDGTVGTITLGGNATWTMSANDEFVFITLTADPSISVPGTSLALDGDVEITDVTADGIQDEAGNDLDLANSEVVVLGAGADTTAPVATAATFAGGTTFGNNTNADVLTVTYDEDVVLNGAFMITVDGVTYDDSELDVTVAGDVLTVVPAAEFAEPQLLDGESQVDGTTGVEDAAGNPANGYPVDIILGS